MDKNLKNIYENHHKASKESFAIFEKQRGKIFSQWIGKEKKILDLGCRDGTLTQHYLKGNLITGADIDKRMLRLCKAKLGIKTIHLNLYETWSFSKNDFDVVVAGELLEHLYNPQEIVKKAYRVLHPKGIFIGSVPNFYHLKRRVQFLLGKPVDVLEDPTHITVFSSEKLKLVLESYFSQVEIMGLGRSSHQKLTEKFPSLFAHTFLFKAEK